MFAKMGHVTLTTPILGVVYIRRLGFDRVYLLAKFEDFSFSRSRDIIGAKILSVLKLVLNS